MEYSKLKTTWIPYFIFPAWEKYFGFVFDCSRGLWCERMTKQLGIQVN